MVYAFAERYVFAPAKLPTTLLRKMQCACGPSAGKHVTYRNYAAAWDRAYTDADRASKRELLLAQEAKQKPRNRTGVDSEMETTTHRPG